MLLEIGIGDCYGRVFEFQSAEFIKERNDGCRYHLRQNEPGQMLGTYTDDTQMSIAIAEFLLTSKSGSASDIGSYFYEAYSRDPHTGYSKRLTKAFDNVGVKMLTQINQNAGMYFASECFTANIVNSNGTVMRSVPLGVLPTPGEVVRIAQMQSLVTHCSAEACMCSQLIAVISHYYYYRKHGGDFSNKKLYDWLKENGMSAILDMCIQAFLDNDNAPVPCDARITTGAVLHVLVNSKTTSQVLTRSVRLGGDTDSVASIASGIAALKDDVAVDYQKPLISDMENGAYGRDYLISLDEAIETKFPRK